MNNMIKNNSQLAAYCLQIRDQSHIWHWQTDKKVTHETLEQFYDDFLDITDQLMQTLISIYGNIDISLIARPSSIINISGVDLVSYYTKKIKVLNAYRNVYQQYVQITIIIQDMMKRLRRLIYKLKFT